MYLGYLAVFCRGLGAAVLARGLLTGIVSEAYVLFFYGFFYVKMSRSSARLALAEFLGSVFIVRRHRGLHFTTSVVGLLC